MIKISEDKYYIIVRNELVSQQVIKKTKEYNWVLNHDKKFWFKNCQCVVDYFRIRDYCVDGNKLLFKHEDTDKVIECRFKTKIKWFNKIGVG
jgi:hypothetical protein